MFGDIRIPIENSYYLHNELGSVRYYTYSILDNLLFASPYRDGVEIMSLAIPDDPNSRQVIFRE
jgi:hypothetical protein